MGLGGSKGHDYAVWKSYPDGTYVELSISKVGDEYEVKSDAENRTSGPAQVVIAETLTFNEALQAAYESCEDWDDWLKDLE